jgi:hypothetical protein
MPVFGRGLSIIARPKSPNCEASYHKSKNRYKRQRHRNKARREVIVFLGQWTPSFHTSTHKLVRKHHRAIASHHRRFIPRIPHSSEVNGSNKSMITPFKFPEALELRPIFKCFEVCSEAGRYRQILHGKASLALKSLGEPGVQVAYRGILVTA